MKQSIHRQGDVLLVPVNKLPEGAKRIKPKRAVIAEGEVTGHVHELIGEVDLYKDSAETIFAKIMSATELKHAEHSTQTIEPGIYRVVRQREYQPKELPRRVAD